MSICPHHITNKLGTFPPGTTWKKQNNGTISTKLMLSSLPSMRAH